MKLPKEIKVQTGMRTRAQVAANSYNADDNTIEVIVATEMEVTRTEYGETFIEVLQVSPESVDTARLDAGSVPFLDNHDRYTGIRAILGTAVKGAYRFEGKQLFVRIKLSTRPDIAGSIQDIKDGIVNNISGGYDIISAVYAGERNGLPIINISRWQLAEISAVPVNADYLSKTRSQEQDNNNAFINVQINIMEDNEQNVNTPAAQPAAAPAAEPAAQPAAAPAAPQSAERAATGERTRATKILSAVRMAKLPQEFAETLINEGVTSEVAHERIVARFAEGGGEAGTRSQHTATVGADNETIGRRQAMTDALMMRAQPGIERKNPTLYTSERVRAAQEFRHDSLMDFARASLQRAQIDTRGADKLDLVKRAITSSTSDFPVILGGVVHQTLLSNYNATADTWRNICLTGSVSDFRDYKRLRMGSLTNLEDLTEDGEFRTKKLTDADSEKISAKTKGNIINVSRKMIVDDDLGAFTRLTAMLGRAAARTIEADVYKMFALNAGAGPTMTDGNPLFHSSHKNIAATGGAPTVAIIDAMRTQMAIQMDKDSNDYLDILPEMWLGPKTLGSAARLLNESKYNPDVSNKFQVPNIVAGLFSKVVDTPRLTGTPWYMLADPNAEPVFEVVFLDGQQEPYMEQKNGFEVDGMEWKIRLDFGVGAIGWRGICKNAGI